jgi:cobalamin biosynthesis Mg chelatase CobN
VIVYGALTLSVAAFYLRFFFTLDRKLQVGLGVAAVLYVGGAIGMEMIAARHLGNDAEDFRYAIYYTIEENLEIIASMLTAIVLLRYLRERETRLLCYVEPPGSEETR